MSKKSNDAASGETPSPSAPAERRPRISLSEFCLRQSETDRRVSLLAGFEHAERQARHLRDSAGAYAARYALYAAKPIQ